MSEMVIDTRGLPDLLFRILGTDRVKVREIDGEVRLTAVAETKVECPLLGIAADCGFTVDDFLARKREEKVLEGA